MIDVVTDLLGEIVEIWTEYNLPCGRGHVRAIYVADRELMILVEHDLGDELIAGGPRTKDGGFEAYSFRMGRVRVVQKCGQCGMWDQKARLFKWPVEGTWEHLRGEGCKKMREETP